MGNLPVTVSHAFGRFSCHGLVRFWTFQLSHFGPLLGVSAVTVWSAFGRFSCHGLVRFWVCQLSRSGPLLGVLAVTVWSAFGRFSCHGLVCFWVFLAVRVWSAFQLSRSGPLLGVSAVTAWTAFWAFLLSRFYFNCYGLACFCFFFSCHGLVRCWAFKRSRSGPLLGVLAVTLWSALACFCCHGLVRFSAFLAVMIWCAFGRSGPLLGV